MQTIWENLDQSIQTANRYIGVIRSDKLLSYNSQIPYIQRLCDNEKVNDIVVYQSARLKQNGVCNFLGVINIHHNAIEQRTLATGLKLFFLPPWEEVNWDGRTKILPFWATKHNSNSPPDIH